MMVLENWEQALLTFNQSGAADFIRSQWLYVVTHKFQSAIMASALVLVVFGWVAHIMEKSRLRQTLANWRTWPTLAQYGQAHPDCMTPNGVHCYLCRAKYIRNHSFGNTTLRMITCKGCGTTLYRI